MGQIQLEWVGGTSLELFWFIDIIRGLVEMAISSMSSIFRPTPEWSIQIGLNFLFPLLLHVGPPQVEENLT
jgi:hypothetical protein